MAKGGMTKTADEMNKERRAMKAKQRAARKAAKKNVTEQFTMKDAVQESKERQRERRLKIRAGVEFGKMVNVEIHRMLDAADATPKKPVRFDINPYNTVQEQAVAELTSFCSQWFGYEIQEVKGAIFLVCVKNLDAKKKDKVAA